MAGSRREVVGRALKALSQEGAVRLERGQIHVLDRAALERPRLNVTQVTVAARTGPQYVSEPPGGVDLQ